MNFVLPFPCHINTLPSYRNYTLHEPTLSLHYTFIRSAIVADVISCLSDLHISLYIYR